MPEENGLNQASGGTGADAAHLHNLSEAAEGQKPEMPVQGEVTGPQPKIHELGGATIFLASRPALAGSDSTRALVKELYERCAAEGGVGLAAPQIGVDLQVAVVDIAGGIRFAMINPVIAKLSGGYVLDKEGCLSLPGVKVMKMRREFVEVVFQDENGKFRKIGTGGLLSRVIQHEIAHLHGVLITDGSTRVFEKTEDQLRHEQKLKEDGSAVEEPKATEAVEPAPGSAQG